MHHEEEFYTLCHESSGGSTMAIGASDDLESGLYWQPTWSLPSIYIGASQVAGLLSRIQFTINPLALISPV